MGSVSVTDLGGGVHRVTHPLPFALNHVHCYAVAGSDGWAVIDTSLWRGAEERWRQALGELGNPRVRSIVLTHYHPDHVGGSEALVRLTGAEEVLQGALDHEFTQRMYEDPSYLDELHRHLAPHGLPPTKVDESVEHEGALLTSVAQPTRLLEEGDVVTVGDSDLTVLVLPGHADGHVALYDQHDGRLFGGDTILRKITPNVATWHDSEPDPLARYLATLERICGLRPSLVYPGHHEPIDDAAGRAREIIEHHRVRLDVHEEALRRGAATTYEVATHVWGTSFRIHEWRFAVGEAISHLVRLTRLGRAREVAEGRWAAL